MGTERRRPRRAVRPGGTVGQDESVLRATLPAPREDAADRSVAEVRTPARREGPGGDLWREVRSADDSDRGWGRDDAPPDDERILREKPPHW